MNALFIIGFFDDPAALTAVVDKRKLDASRWTLAAPPADEVRAVAGVLGVRYRKLADGEMLGPRFFAAAPSLNGNSAPTPEAAVALVRSAVETGSCFT